jgi:hypothetical protein
MFISVSKPSETPCVSVFVSFVIGEREGRKLGVLATFQGNPLPVFILSMLFLLIS